MADMGKVLIFGHRNPDTDSICSALAYADLKAQCGEEVEAVRLGAVSSETQFALDTFGATAPRLVQTVAGETSRVILVDHNERQQSAPDIAEVTVVEVIDHHRIANFETAGPLYFRSEPVGSTSTILWKLFREMGIVVGTRSAGLMLSAIISDTLVLRSPTCTAEDTAAAQELAALAGVDLQTYGRDMLRAGANLLDKPIAELISLDAKEFSMSGAKVVVAQVNAVDVEDVLSRQPELEAAMQEVIATKSLDLFLVVVTDILQCDSIGVALGPRAHAVEAAYGIRLEGHRARLRGVVSRKAQVIPQLTEAFAK